MRQITSNEKTYWIAFLHVDGIGPITLKRLIQNGQDLGFELAEIWQMNSVQQLTVMGLSDIQQQAFREFKKHHSPISLEEEIRSAGVEVIAYEDDQYPPNLIGLDDAPQILYSRGNLELLQVTRAMAVVGTRRMTSYGVQAGQKIVKELIQDEYLIVSGFMYGVDQLAHRVAIAKRGQSIGVLGYGHNQIQTSSTQKLADQFLAAGNLLISEYSPNIPGQKAYFPQRNRIVAGLSLGTVVIEAGPKSGTFITVHKAVEYGREVYAVSGPITSEYAEGTKKILNNTGHLITNGWEVCAYLENKVRCLVNQSVGQAGPEFGSKLEAQIYAQLKTLALNVDELAEALHKSVDEVMAALSLLEVNGLISRLGNQWSVNI